ncbi:MULTISPECIES: nitroreductase family protein [Streptomyces]|nr:nitroreductase family protein [Streptomyces canarius]
MPFTDVVRARRSVRNFLPPLSPSDIRGVLEDAQRAPSNCDTQPWTVHVVSGATRDGLSKEIRKADDEGRFSYDFTFDYADFGEGIHLDRAHHHAATLTQATGLKREDRTARKAAAREGLMFFGAPHVAFLFMPAFGDGVRAAGDIGMYGQNFLLSGRSRVRRRPDDHARLLRRHHP